MQIGAVMKKARNAMGPQWTRKVLGKLIGISHRTIEAYECGDQIPPADAALAISKATNAPLIVQEYCRHVCSIGQHMAYEVLDTVDKSLPAVILKLACKFKAADAALSKIMYLSINKTGRKDFTLEEWRDFDEAIQIFFDIEHNIGVLKEVLWQITDVSVLVAEHNQKCFDRGYCAKEKTARLEAAV